jgi:DoxX-like family
VLEEMTMAINIGLWVVQVLLALVFLFAGGMKLVLPLGALTGPVALPGLLLQFIGVAEVTGAIGLILPGIFQIRQGLTPLAAAGLVIIMTGATVITVIFMDAASALVPLIVGLLSAGVAYGRWRLARPAGAPAARAPQIMTGVKPAEA